jgi:SAM-dependent methyltransferase
MDPAMNGTFDLVVVADTLYYLPPPLLDSALHSLASKVSQLLTRDGILMIANHYFPLPIAETRLTKRIHAAFASCLKLRLIAEHKRAFFLASIYTSRGAESCAM